MDRVRPPLFPVASALIFFLGFEAGGFQLALLRIAGVFALDSAAMGRLAAVQYLAIVLTPLAVGGLADRIGKKKTTAGFCLVFVAGCVLAAISPNILCFAAGVFVTGAGYSICESSVSAALADTGGEKARRALNLTQCFFSLGAVFGPMVCGFLMDHLQMGWRAVFLIAAGAYAALYPFVCRTRFPAAPERKAAAKTTETKLWTVVFGGLLIAIICYIGLENGIAYFLDSYCVQVLEIPALSAPALSFFWLMMAVSRFAAGILPRLGTMLLLICFGGAALALAALTCSESGTLAFVCSGLLGMLAGPVWPTLIALASQEFPGRSGEATNIMVAGCGASGAFTPMLLGGVMGLWGGRAVFLLLTVTAAAGFVIVYFLKKETRRQ